jgi:hypothetical protein
MAWLRPKQPREPRGHKAHRYYHSLTQAICLAAWPTKWRESAQQLKSNNVAALNSGRDPAIKEEKKIIESDNVAALNVSRDPAVKEEKKMIETSAVRVTA